jgi:protein-tyrosine phosphatase
MIDIHSHILPGIDDGAKDWETAIAMVRASYEDGVRHMVATPHANDRYQYDRAAFEKLLAELRERCGVNMELSLGCDFHFSYDNIQAALEEPGRFCIGRTNYLLVEFSDHALSPRTADTLHRFLSAGITPIITHPERNPILQRSPERLREFVQIGCLAQVTAKVLIGKWGETALKAARWMLDRECIHIVASDAHDTEKRPPQLSGARHWLARHYGAATAKALCEDNPGAVVTNQWLQEAP